MAIVNLEIDQPVRNLAIVGDLAPARMLAAVARGLDTAAYEVAGLIQEERLTGQGPFPADEGKLGVRSGRYRASLHVVPAVVSGGTVTESGIGTNAEYAAIHEFGGEIHRTVKAGSVRLRTDRKGNLMKRGNLATFARASHKGVREVPFAGGKEYTIRIPARAPIGSGMADHQDVFVREIERSLIQELEGGTQP